MDPGGVERVGNEGYLPKTEFRAWLEISLARLAFIRKEWEDAGLRYGGVIERYPETAAAPEAVYWKGVSRYKRGDHAALGETAAELSRRFPGSIWTRKSSVWAH